MPSAKYSCSGSPLKFENGRTATDGLSGNASTDAGRAFVVRRMTIRCDRRPDIAIAAARQSLDPTRSAGDFLKHPAQGRDLNRQIAVFDRKSRPRGLDQRLFRNRRARPLQQQPKQRDRALAEGDRLGAAKQYFGVPVEAKWTEFVASRPSATSGYLSETFCNDFGTDSRPPGRGGRMLRRWPCDAESPSHGGVHVSEAKAVIRMPGEGKEHILAGQPMAVLVTGEDSKHTCMFDWTLPAGFRPAFTCTASRKKPST